MRMFCLVGRPSYLYCILIALFYMLSWFLFGEQNAVEVIPVSDKGKAILDYMAEMMKLTVTVNSAMFSAAAALAIKGKDWSTRWGAIESFLVVIALVMGAVSYYGVYASHVWILEMMYAGGITPFNQNLQIALFLQYHGTLLGVFLIGFIFTRMLESR